VPVAALRAATSPVQAALPGSACRTPDACCMSAPCGARIHNPCQLQLRRCLGGMRAHLRVCASCRMRSLETAATAGVFIVLALAGIIAVEALRAGQPAIASGELPLWELQARPHVCLRSG